MDSLEDILRVAPEQTCFVREQLGPKALADGWGNCRWFAVTAENFEHFRKNPEIIALQIMDACWLGILEA